MLKYPICTVIKLDYRCNLVFMGTHQSVAKLKAGDDIEDSYSRMLRLVIRWQDIILVEIHRAAERRWPSVLRYALSAFRRCVYDSAGSQRPRNSRGMRPWCQSALPFLTLMNDRRNTRLRRCTQAFLECPLTSWRPISVSQKCNTGDERRERSSPGGSPLCANI